MAQTPLGDPPLADAMVLFGATGDLSRRMLLPSLYFLDADGLLPAGFKILATARGKLSRDDFVADSPSLYDGVCGALAGSGLANERSRIVLEKPIGRDLETSREVNRAVGA